MNCCLVIYSWKRERFIGGKLRVRAAMLYTSCLSTLFFCSSLARLPLYTDTTVPCLGVPSGSLMLSCMQQSGVELNSEKLGFRNTVLLIL